MGLSTLILYLVRGTERYMSEGAGGLGTKRDVGAEKNGGGGRSPRPRVENVDMGGTRGRGPANQAKPVTQAPAPYSLSFSTLRMMAL